MDDEETLEPFFFIICDQEKIHLWIVCFHDKFSALLVYSKDVYESRNERLPKRGGQQESDQGCDEGWEGHLGTGEDTLGEISEKGGANILKKFLGGKRLFRPYD